MSGTLKKLFEEGKAKVKEFSGSHSSHSSHPQGGGYPGQGYPSQHQYSGCAYPPSYPPVPPQSYNAPPPGQYPQYPSNGGPPPLQHQQQWGPPQNQWGSPPPQQPFSPPPQQPLSPPNAHHPQSPQPPPLPGNRPGSQPPPIPSNRPVSQPPASLGNPPNLRVYWQPSFDDSTPVSHNFRHELGDHGWGNNEKQNYVDNPANSFHYDNKLVVRGLVRDGSYTSARLTSHQTLSRPQGYLTATILPPCAEGIWPAYWMLPKDPFQWPTDGEVDIMETWNGDCVNHSCLHWGAYNGEDWDKHRVIETKFQDMPGHPHTYGFAWIEEEGIPDWRGRMIWYIDGRPVMKGTIPQGTRRMEDFRILINIAMGGNVCKGVLPKDGWYDLTIGDLKMCEEPIGGWDEFEKAWNSTAEGKTM